MKQRLSIVRLLVFLLLVFALFKALYWLFILFCQKFFFYSLTMFIAKLLGAALVMLILGTFLFGAFALWIGKLNPYPAFGKFLSLAVVLYCLYAWGWDMYILSLNHSPNEMVTTAWSFAGLVLLYMTVKLYRLLDYHGLTYR